MSRHNKTDATSPNALNPGKDRDLVAATLKRIMRDKTSPAAAKAQAARTLAEMSRALGRHQDPNDAPIKPVRALTRAELEAELVELRAERAAR